MKLQELGERLIKIYNLKDDHTEGWDCFLNIYKVRFDALKVDILWQAIDDCDTDELVTIYFREENNNYYIKTIGQDRDLPICKEEKENILALLNLIDTKIDNFNEDICIKI